MLYMLFGVIFLVVGILGFFNNPILGLFEVNTVHNLIHIVSGIIALAMVSKGEAQAKLFGKVFGIVYALVAVLGFLLPGGDIFGLMTVNMADNVLHIVLAIVFLWVGFGSMKSGMQTA